MNLSRAGVDIAKSVFHVHVVDRHGQPKWRAKLKRTTSGWMRYVNALLLALRWGWRPVPRPITGPGSCRREDFA
ncbi:MAG: hypothetical protein WBM58_14185 [Sedimenticolaceae bacterium]